MRTGCVGPLVRRNPCSGKAAYAAVGGPLTTPRPERADTVAMSSEEACVVLSTFPSALKADEVARALVTEQLAACVSLVPAVRSIYRWQEEIHEDIEVLAVIKTTRARFDALAARLAVLHPYDVPEIIALPLAAVHAPYLAWLIEAVR